jgi:DNA polymerase
VFGEGSAGADVMLVGEQPGDREDQEGHPFVGPAGRLLDRALADAGIDRGDTYVTNAVKHFKWAARGRRRIHQNPSSREVVACAPWLDGELAAVRPRLVVALGATAAKALLGPDFKVTQQRGEMHDIERAGRNLRCTATVHPSAILRAADDRDAAYAAFVADLEVAARSLG